MMFKKGDIVRFTHPSRGWDHGLYRVLNIDYRHVEPLIYVKSFDDQFELWVVYIELISVGDLTDLQKIIFTPEDV